VPTVVSTRHADVAALTSTVPTLSYSLCRQGLVLQSHRLHRSGGSRVWVNLAQGQHIVGVPASSPPPPPLLGAVPDLHELLSFS
jgi:hypothetical protein